MKFLPSFALSVIALMAMTATSAELENVIDIAPLPTWKYPPHGSPLTACELEMAKLCWQTRPSQ